MLLVVTSGTAFPTFGVALWQASASNACPAIPPCHRRHARLIQQPVHKGRPCAPCAEEDAKREAARAEVQHPFPTRQALGWPNTRPDEHYCKRDGAVAGKQIDPQGWVEEEKPKAAVEQGHGMCRFVPFSLGIARKRCQATGVGWVEDQDPIEQPQEQEGAPHQTIRGGRNGWRRLHQRFSAGDGQVDMLPSRSWMTEMVPEARYERKRNGTWHTRANALHLFYSARIDLQDVEQVGIVPSGAQSFLTETALQSRFLAQHVQHDMANDCQIMC